MLLPGGLTVAKTVRVVLLHLVIMALLPHALDQEPARVWLGANVDGVRGTSTGRRSLGHHTTWNFRLNTALAFLA